MAITRRHLLQGSALAAIAPALGLNPSLSAITPAFADDAPNGLKWRHGLSTYGEIKYPADFKRYDYVNPDAPKGGVVRLFQPGTYDSFNLVVAGLKGTVSAAVARIYDSLMEASLDEPDTYYGELAEGATFPDDFSYVTYRLRPGSRWHDGKPVTPEDVIFSFEAWKANSPMFSGYYRHITKAEKVGDRDIKFTFDSPGNRELPMITGQLIILPKHWWEGSDAQGNKRDVTASTLEPPLGSGPYKIKEFVAGRSVVLERVKDYWGKDIPIAVGQNNFDELRYEYFRDDTVAREV